ncbi:MAG: hypothetical protein LBU45_07625 [Azoarcus sp.]|nr:hypothetical protein [Azoarcus sp.]
MATARAALSRAGRERRGRVDCRTDFFTLSFRQKQRVYPPAQPASELIKVIFMNFFLLMLLFIGQLVAFSAMAEPLKVEVPKVIDLTIIQNIEPPKPDCGKPLTLPEADALEVEMIAYLRLSEEALTMRAEAIETYHTLKAKRETGSPLSGADLKILNESAAQILRQRDAILETALKHECWIKTQPDNDPKSGTIQRAGALISVSSALLLFDNYLSAIVLYRSDPELRRHFNRADSGVDLSAFELQRTELMFNAPTNRARMREAFLWVNKYTLTPPNDEVELFEGYTDMARYLRQSIQQSPSYHHLNKTLLLRLGDTITSNLGSFGRFLSDFSTNMWQSSEYVASLIVGNAIGVVETRKGKLYNLPEITNEIGGVLKAGDILLEKTPFKLTDSAIPGHFGHAAIWIGTEPELKVLGIWEHPVVIPYQATIREGKSIVEALRNGVTTNTLNHFLNIDDLAVLRHINQTDKTRAESILQTLRQIGKGYDYNFDAETTERIYCSKLVYLVYGEVQWPTSRMLGRYTVAPDDIASEATKGDPIEIIMLYQDGKRITGALPKVMTKLLSGS